MHDNETILELCCAAGRRWARRCPGLDPEDCAQEAVVVALAAEAGYDPARDTTRAGYLRSAVERTLAHYALRSRSPVTYLHRPGKLIGLRAVGYDEAYGVATLGTPEDAAAAAELRAAIGEALADLTDAALACRVLLAGDTPAEAAARARVPALRVYRAVAGARRRLAASAKLRTLWAT